MAPDPVRAALYACLSGDATLKGLLSSPGEIHEEIAPAGTEPPYLIFNRQGGVPIRAFGTSSDRPIWLVKGVCRGDKSTPAEEIDARCQVLLDGTKLEISGRLATVVRESIVPYGEESDGERWRHRGSLYRIYA